jgi:hypothetical protein
MLSINDQTNLTATTNMQKLVVFCGLLHGSCVRRSHGDKTRTHDTAALDVLGHHGTHIFSLDLNITTSPLSKPHQTSVRFSKLMGNSGIWWDMVRSCNNCHEA